MKTSSLLLSSLLCLQLHAVELPTCEWVFSAGGGSSDKARAVTTDGSGNVFVASECIGDATFGDQQHKSAGGMDMCLVKLDVKGRALWVTALGGSKTDRAYGLITDAAGNAYVTGHFESTDAVVNGETLPNAGNYDVFTAKFSPDGKVLWVRVKGGEGSDYGHGIVRDSKGHLVITGAIGGQFFATKYDADGREIWHRAPSGKVSGSGHGIAIDGQDHIYLGGSASGTGSFGKAGIESKTSAAMVLKLSPEGDGVWVNLIPGTTSAIYHEITSDSQGRVWGAGMFKGSVSVAGETFECTDTNYDGLIVHLDAGGQVQWAKHMHGPGTDYCLGVVTDDHGTAFVCGDFNQDTVLAGHALTTSGSGDIFVAAFDPKGSLAWVQQAGGKLNDSAYPISFQSPNSLIIAGSFTAPATFGQHAVTKSASSDLYAAKWKLR